MNRYKSFESVYLSENGLIKEIVKSRFSTDEIGNCWLLDIDSEFLDRNNLLVKESYITNKKFLSRDSLLNFIQKNMKGFHLVSRIYFF